MSLKNGSGTKTKKWWVYNYQQLYLIKNSVHFLKYLIMVVVHTYMYLIKLYLPYFKVLNLVEITF